MQQTSHCVRLLRLCIQWIHRQTMGGCNCNSQVQNGLGVRCLRRSSRGIGWVWPINVSLIPASENPTPNHSHHSDLNKEAVLVLGDAFWITDTLSAIREWKVYNSSCIEWTPGVNWPRFPQTGFAIDVNRQVPQPTALSFRQRFH